jgi:hypothetical protein
MQISEALVVQCSIQEFYKIKILKDRMLTFLLI